nr:hypothetical protein [Mycoplasmopsis bovis]
MKKYKNVIKIKNKQRRKNSDDENNKRLESNSMKPDLILRHER